MVKLANDLLTILGEVDSEQNENVHGNEHTLVKMKFVNKKTVNGLTGQLMNWTTSVIIFCEWILKQLKTTYKGKQSIF